MLNRFARLKNFFLNNWELKLPAVLLAALSFYAIRGATGYEVPYDIPLEVKVEKGIAILDQPKTVKVTFRGSQEDLRRLDQKQIKAVVRPRVSDLAGSESVSISPGNIEGAPDVTVVRIVPGTVTLTFDREDEKKVPVAKPEIIGTPRIGKVEIDYEPRFVVIRGPRQRLKDKKIVETEPVDVDGLGESFSRQVRVLSPGAGTRSFDIEPSEIMVKVNIVTETVSREWTNVMVLAVMKPGTATHVDLSPSTVNVSLYGRAEVLDSIPDDAVKVFVNCAGLSSSGLRRFMSHKLPVNVHLPPGVDVTATVEPGTVRVRFRRE